MSSITQLCAGKRFFDAIPDGDDFRLRFEDGVEIKIAWESDGPKTIGIAHGIITTERALHSQFRYVTGKVVEAVYTDGNKLVVRFTDGHELRSSFRAKPTVDAIDVKIKLEPASAIAIAQP